MIAIYNEEHKTHQWVDVLTVKAFTAGTNATERIKDSLRFALWQLKFVYIRFRSLLWYGGMYYSLDYLPHMVLLTTNNSELFFHSKQIICSLETELLR